MPKILISLPDDLLKGLNLFTERYSYERYEFLSKLIREAIYPKDIPKVEITDITGLGTVQDIPSIPVGEIPEKIKEKKEKAIEALKSIGVKPALFCPKHGTMKVGETYSCGCKV